MKLEKLRQPLRIDQIDFRVQSVNKGQYVTILAYKNARVDMERLDEVCGALNWKREHTRDNHNCIVSIYDAEHTQWVSKEDTGTESNTEAQKGLASDSFKRACFNWGIGRELYDYPQISFKLNKDEVQEYNGKFRPSFNFKLREWNWYAEHDADGKVSFLACQDNNGKTRWTHGTKRTTANKTEAIALIDQYITALNMAADNHDPETIAELSAEIKPSHKKRIMAGLTPTTVEYLNSIKEKA